MSKILIIGGNGAGKSYLSKILSNELNLPVIHLDKIWWKDEWQNISKEEFDNILRSELMKDNWIIDGNFARTFNLRYEYCDAVIYLDFSTVNCIVNVFKRTLVNYGKSRDDMGGNCVERFDINKLKFFKDIINFNKNNRKNFYNVLNKSTKKVVILKNRSQVNKFIRNKGYLYLR